MGWVHDYLPSRIQSDVLLKSFNQCVKRHPAARTVSQVLMHGDPGIQRQSELPRKDPHDLSVAPSDGNLAHTDTGTGSDQRELRQIVIRPHRECLAPPGAQHLSRTPNERRRFIKSNEGMVREI